MPAADGPAPLHPQGRPGHGAAEHQLGHRPAAADHPEGPAGADPTVEDHPLHARAGR